jgi:hypothetical protein
MELMGKIHATLPMVALIGILLLLAGAIVVALVRMYYTGKAPAPKSLIGIVFFALALHAAATKPKTGSVRINDPYIKDTGSYLTNDICHVAIQKQSLVLLDSTPILVYARPHSSTNTADWFRLEPYLTLVDHPYDYSLPNATNYNVVVAADVIPPEIVHTNGVLTIKGFIIPGTDGKMSFPATRIETKE